MADRLAAERVSRLDPKRVERPEVLLGGAKQGAPAEPPASATPSSTSAAPIPVNSRTRTKTSPTHAVTISGATPKIAAGSTIEAIQASASFGRLISARRLPAIARSDFCFGLEASSSASPSRGSRIGRAGSGAGRSSPDWALEEMTSGARKTSDEDFPTAPAHSMRRLRPVAKPAGIAADALLCSSEVQSAPHNWRIPEDPSFATSPYPSPWLRD